MLVSDVYRTLWRRKFFVLLVVGFVVAAAFLLTSRQTKMYTSYSLIRVQQKVSENDVLGALVTGERLARTYERIAETYAIREIVNEGLPEGVSSGNAVIDVRQLSNLELLQIAVSDPDPATAEAVANEVPPALSRFIKDTGTFRDTITVVERAGRPAIPSSPNLRLNITLALILGLILGGALALLKEGVSDRIDDIEELERATRHPVIATIPNLKFGTAKTASRLKPESRRIEPAPIAATSSGAQRAEAPAAPARWSARG